MTLFFTCIILVGSGLTVFSIMLMLYEKKRLHDYRSDLREKKEDLINIIEDAEELITEMNRFSEYTITQLEEKNEFLLKSLAEADLKIEMLNSVEICESFDVKSDHPVYNVDSVNKIIEEEKCLQDKTVNTPTPIRKGKVLTFDSKRREIIKLAKSGLCSTEIARLLNCGKGEIELIARMGR